MVDELQGLGQNDAIKGVRRYVIRNSQICHDRRTRCPLLYVQHLRSADTVRAERSRVLVIRNFQYASVNVAGIPAEETFNVVAAQRLPAIETEDCADGRHSLERAVA